MKCWLIAMVVMVIAGAAVALPLGFWWIINDLLTTLW